MNDLRRHIKEAAEASPTEVRPAIFAIGRALERLFDELRVREAEIASNLRELREAIDPVIYDRVRMLAAGLSLELAEAYARLADVEIRATLASGERAALRAGLRQAAEDREGFEVRLTQAQARLEELVVMVAALAADLATLRAHVEHCCGPDGPRERAPEREQAVGEVGEVGEEEH